MSDPEQFEIPGHLTVAEGNGGLPKLLVTTPFSTAEIYLHGAHITAFRKNGEPPLLFMSAGSNFATDRAIRGGVPIIFPWFGAREGVPAHGFARTVGWDLRESQLLPDGSVQVRLGMPAVKSYEVEYLVTVSDTLTMELVVGNTDKKDATFETSLHAYFHVGAIDTVSIHGLKDTGYFDKVKDAGALETADSIRITGETDRVYFDTTAAVEIIDPSLGRRIFIEKSGSRSTVVWNPWIEKARSLDDFGDDEYLSMVCVEPGNVGKNKITLPPCGRTTLKVVVSSSPS
ncbi:MAG: D-hexose-6-phosphate mutarotase [Verrucomicrobiaceae bacterium]|nr:MAG: D-hexose-6-phosphate mutarotase [Verrucomicrobiaceae bacterium]